MKTYLIFQGTCLDFSGQLRLLALNDQCFLLLCLSNKVQLFYDLDAE